MFSDMFKPIFIALIATCGLLMTSSILIASDTELDQLVQEAVMNNPDLAAMESRWQQNSQKSIQVGSLSDPVLSLALSNFPRDTLSTNDFNMTGFELKLSQMFPFPGKLENRKSLANEQADWYQAQYHDKQLLVARKVKDSWFRLYYNQMAIEVVQRNMKLVDNIIRLAETRYETGQGLQQDVLKSQVQKSRLMERLMTLRQQRVSLEAELNRTLGRTDNIPIRIPGKVELPHIDYSLEEFHTAGLEKRPQNLAFQSLIQRYRHQKKLAELDDYPDVTVWGSWRFRDNSLPDGGTDFVSAGISVPLPVYREKRRAAAAEAVAAQRMAEHQFAEFRNSVKESLEKAYARMEETREQTSLYSDGIIPQSSQSFQSALSAYQVGKLEFISLMDALMTTFNAELDFYRVSSEYMRSLAWLEAESTIPLIGQPLQLSENISERGMERLY